MEDNSQKPSAEEQDEPQNIPTTKEGIAPPEKSQEPTTPKEANEVPVAEKKEKTTELNTDETQEEPVDYSKFSIDELIEVYKELCTSDQWLKNHSQIQAVGTIFENKFHADVEANKKTFVEEGGNEIDFFYKPEYKKSFDQIGFEYRTKRRSHYKDQQASYKVNLERKKAIIEEIKSLIGADQNINTIYKTFRTLQESWYSTGPVSRADNHNLWETFKHHVERFYDFLHLNRELRELDYKNNYEEKLKIIERTEALKDVPDIIQASRDLNTLHQLWKNDLGPVAKEHREDLWKRFQDATKIIQARRQEYQKDIAGAKKENLEKKNALLKEMEILVENKPENHNGWQNALKKFNQLRETFKTIGQVPSKVSKISWQRFRDVGRAFMHEKNIFYKNQKQEYNQNINAKKAFITRSKEILDSPEWDSKVQEMKNLQKDWKSIGFVPRKLDNKLWSEFSEIHKVFFDRIKSGYQRLSEEQEAILNEKRTFLEQLKTTQFSDDPETLQTELNAQWENWNAIVKIGGQTEIDLNKEFSSSLTKIVSNIKLDDKTQKEVLLGLNSLLLQNNPEKLQKQLNDIKTTLSRLKTERTQLENNLEFFSQSSSENPLFKNVEKQIKSCQTKIDKTQEEYIRLKQIKNAQLKLAKQQSEQAEKDSNQESEEV